MKCWTTYARSALTEFYFLMEQLLAPVEVHLVRFSVGFTVTVVYRPRGNIGYQIVFTRLVHNTAIDLWGQLTNFSGRQILNIINKNPGTIPALF